MAVNTQQTPARPVSPMSQGLRGLRRNPMALISGAVILVLVVVAVLASVIAPYGFDVSDRGALLADPSAKHLLGTDNRGWDILSRLLYGARVSLSVGVIVEAIEVTIGLAIGLLAAYKGGWWDRTLMRMTDAMFAFPDLLFAILLVGIFRPDSPAASVVTVFVALAVVNWPSMARLVRGQAMQLREKEYVEAARAMGVPGRSIVLRHILPNMITPIIVAVTVDIANVILAEATLSFLGIGIQAPYPSWGRMIYEARSYMRSTPSLLLWPSVALGLTVLAFNFFGDALRDAFDPRAKR